MPKTKKTKKRLSKFEKKSKTKKKNIKIKYKPIIYKNLTDLLDKKVTDFKEKNKLLELKTRIAIFFDPTGEIHGKKTFNKNDNFIYYGNKAYVVDLKTPSVLKIGGLIWNKYFYFYNTENVEPIQIKNKFKSSLNPETFYIMLKTETGRKLNNISNSLALGNLLTPRNIFIALIVLVAIFYLLSHKGAL